MLTKLMKEPKRDSLLIGVKWIVILCFFDALATDVGIRMHMVKEVNPFAKLLYETNVAIFYSYKLFLPLALLAMCPYLKKRAFINRLIFFTATLYALLALYHIGWIVFVILLLLKAL